MRKNPQHGYPSLRNLPKINRFEILRILHVVEDDPFERRMGHIQIVLHKDRVIQQHISFAVDQDQELPFDIPGKRKRIHTQRNSVTQVLCPFHKKQLLARVGHHLLSFRFLPSSSYMYRSFECSNPIVISSGFSFIPKTEVISSAS